MIAVNPVMSEVPKRPDLQPPSPDEGAESTFVSDEPTIGLMMKARGGNREAAEALLQRCMPQLRRWAHGRLPAAARGALDTGDLVQETVLHVLRRLDTFEPRHVGAMQAYLRQSVINRIRDEVRRIGRQPAPVELPEDLRSHVASPLESAVKTEAYERYREALAQLSPRDREIIVARIEVQWSFAEIAERFRMRTPDAARMAVARALKRLTDRLTPPAHS
jgi:RNA polymerase sigma-70 factor (ECF subfamily)